MLVRDMNTGRLIMLPNRPSAPLGYNDERLGLPILAALPALVAKALPIITSILPMFTSKGSSAPAPASPPPALPPAPVATPAPLPLPTVQTFAPAPPVDSAMLTPPMTSTMRTTDVDTEVVVQPMPVRQPNGQIAMVPMRVRRRRRQRRVRTMRVAPPVATWPAPMLMRPMPVPVARYPIY
jgi:hypothetical protein